MPEHAFSPDIDDQKLLAQVVQYYQRALKENAKALDYLRKRGITAGDALDHFAIGFSDRTLGKKLPPKQLKAGREIRERLQRLGILRGTGHEHFRGSLTFPVHAGDGTRRIADVYGRKIGGNLRKGTVLHSYLTEKRAGVWNVEAFAASQEVIITKGLFDGLTFWNHGYRNVSCIFESLTDEHLTAFGEFGIERVLLTFEDEDTISRLLDGFEVFRIRLPIGLDVNEYALQVKEPADALGTLIRKAEWVGKPSIGCEETAVEDNEEDAGDTFSSDKEPAAPESEVEPVPPPVSVIPPAPEVPEAESPEPDLGQDEIRLTFGSRRYRIRGLARNLSYEVLKVNVLVSSDAGLFVDTFDFYSARHRILFVNQAARELGVEEGTIKKDMGKVLLRLEAVQDERIQAALKPRASVPDMTEGERQEALDFLKDPRLLDRIQEDFESIGLVGERTNKLMAYLATVSRKLPEPLAILVQSSSAAGKTALMEAVLSFVPEEDRVKYSAMTGQSLYYVGEDGLRHKVLAIVEGEGAERASYALKLLQSEGELVIASTGKDDTGRLVTQEYRVQGPVMIFLTTTAIDIDEELLNRCIVLSVDEDREQTRAIHQWQRERETLRGLVLTENRTEVLRRHRNAQRLLKPLPVVNPFAESLTFLDTKTRTRRDHVKYLVLIRTLALLRQYQRERKSVSHHGRTLEYVEVNLDDIEMANELAHEVLGRSLDELPPQSRRLLSLVSVMVKEGCQREGKERADYRFTRRDIREYTGWGQTQLKVHLRRLEDLEYLLVHRGGRGQSFLYELVFDAETEGRVMPGLLDVQNLPDKDGEP